MRFVLLIPGVLAFAPTLAAQAAPPAVNNGTIDYITTITNAIDNMVTSDGGAFLFAGNEMLTTLGVIMLVVCGLRLAGESASRHHGEFPFPGADSVLRFVPDRGGADALLRCAAALDECQRLEHPARHRTLLFRNSRSRNPRHPAQQDERHRLERGTSLPPEPADALRLRPDSGRHDPDPGHSVRGQYSGIRVHRNRVAAWDRCSSPGWWFRNSAGCFGTGCSSCCSTASTGWLPAP